MINFKFFFHPHFVIKYYLLKDIKFILGNYPFKKDLLDVGCGDKPYKKLFKNVKSYKGIDFKNYSRNDTYGAEKPDIFFPKDYLNTFRLPFVSSSFDNVVAFQVLEHHPDPEKMIGEIVRVVKNNGLILISAPFIWSMHEEPNDYYRFTKYCLIRIFKRYNCEIIELKQQGSFFSALISLSVNFLMEYSNKNIAFYFLSILIYPLFLFLSYACLVLDKIFLSKKIALNYLILAKKM